MNSLEELNTHSATTLPDYTDLRPARLVFDKTTPTVGLTITRNQGESQDALVGIEIDDVINYDLMTSYYEIDISACVGASISWSTVPVYMTVTNPSTGVYRISGFRSPQDWLDVRDPSVLLPYEYFGTFSYSSKISYTPFSTGVAVEKTWSVAETINDVTTLTATSDFFWNISASQIITGTPTVVNEMAPTRVYTLTITPSSGTSITSMSSTGTGGSSTFNATSKVLTLVGTRDQVNSRLAQITLVANTTSQNYTMTYQISNNQNGDVDTKTQSMKCANIRYLGLLSTPTITYDEDTDKAVSGGPQVTDIDYDGSGTYTMTITGPGVKTLSATGSGGSATFNSTTKTLSIVGTRTQVNSYINNITFRALPDYVSSFDLTYTIRTPRNVTQAKAQAFIVGSTHAELSGLDIQRYYAKNTGTYIFGNTTYVPVGGGTATLAQSTPSITDVDTTGVTYGFTISASSGNFSVDGYTMSSSYSFTGTRAQMNSQFAAVRYYANKDATSNSTITYTQFKDGNTQFTQNFTLQSVNTSGTTYTKNYSFTSSQTWNVPIEARLYSITASVFLVGAGGAGTVGAGGGGGQCLSTSITLVDSSYPITIGSGGTPVYSFNLDASSYAVMRGGTTSAFGLSAVGGYGGVWGLNAGDHVFTGGASGGGSAGGADAPTAVNYHGPGGGGGGSTRTFGYPVYLGSNTWTASGYPANYQSGFGWNGGAGGIGYEYPPGSHIWYAGGGGGAGGPVEYTVNPPSQYNVSLGPAFVDPAVTSSYNAWSGGGYGQAPNDDPSVPYIPGADRANGKKGGGGGGGTFADNNAGYGGNGVVIVTLS